MSRVNRCLDNQPIEQFWGTLKAERYYLKKHNTYEELFEDVSNYIRYYNNYRYTERLTACLQTNIDKLLNDEQRKSPKLF